MKRVFSNAFNPGVDFPLTGGMPPSQGPIPGASWSLGRPMPTSAGKAATSYPYAPSQADITYQFNLKRYADHYEDDFANNFLFGYTPHNPQVGASLKKITTTKGPHNTFPRFNGLEGGDVGRRNESRSYRHQTVMGTAEVVAMSLPILNYHLEMLDLIPMEELKSTFFPLGPCVTGKSATDNHRLAPDVRTIQRGMKWEIYNIFGSSKKLRTDAPLFFLIIPVTRQSGDKKTRYRLGTEETGMHTVTNMDAELSPWHWKVVPFVGEQGRHPTPKDLADAVFKHSKDSKGATDESDFLRIMVHVLKKGASYWPVGRVGEPISNLDANYAYDYMKYTHDVPITVKAPKFEMWVELSPFM